MTDVGVSALRQDILTVVWVSAQRQGTLNVGVSVWRQDILADVEMSDWRLVILKVFGVYYGLLLSKVHKIPITRHYRVLTVPY